VGKFDTNSCVDLVLSQSITVEVYPYVHAD